VLTNMVLRRVARGVRTYFDSYKFYNASRIPNKGRIPGKIFRVKTGRIPRLTYSKADVYRGTTVPTFSTVNPRHNGFGGESDVRYNRLKGYSGKYTIGYLDNTRK
jgi:hypothetical protein